MRWWGGFAIALWVVLFAFGIALTASSVSAALYCGSSSCSLTFCGEGNAAAVYCADFDGNPCTDCSAGICDCRAPPETCRADGLSCSDTGDCCQGLSCNAGVCGVAPEGPSCGNGVVETGEQCDLAGINGACPSTCTLSCDTQPCPDVRRGKEAGTNWISYTIDEYANPPAFCDFGSPNLQSCESDKLCTNIGSIVGTAAGEGFTGWLCKKVGEYQDPALITCDSSTVGDTATTTNTAGASVSYCCTDTGGTYAFVSGVCGPAAGIMRSGGADGRYWGTEAGNPPDGGQVYEIASAHAPCPNDQCIPPGGVGSCMPSAPGDDLLCTVPALNVLWSGSYPITGTYGPFAWYKCDGTKLGQELKAYDDTSPQYYVCTQDAACAYEFRIGSKSVVCIPPSFNPDCSRPACGSPDVYIGDGSTYNTNTVTDQGWTWQDTRESPLDPSIPDTRPSLSCDANVQCTPLNAADNDCYAVGETNDADWGPNPNWVCGDDGSGDPAWYICHGGKVNHIYPGTDRCCKSGPYRFVTADSTCCAQDGVCNEDCGSDPDCGAGCESNCAPPYARMCVGADPADYRWCRDLDGDGCYRWTYYSCSGSRPICSGGICVGPDCDADNDGSNDNRTPRSGPPGPTSCTLSTQRDCRSDNAAVRPGLLESAGNRCIDGWDNDCEGVAISTREADYDGWSAWTGNPVNGSTREGLGPAPKGDSACLVGISRTTGIVATPSVVDTYAECTTNFTISCTANVGNIRSIEVSGPTKCSWKQWSGATATFTCERPTTDGTLGYSCFVNTSESYAANNATHNSSVSTAVTFDCLRPVGGIVRDAAHQTAISGAVVSYNGSTVTKTTDGAGVYNFTGADEVPVGSYNFLANKSGYYASRRTNVNVSSSPMLVDFNMSEEQCTAQCTFGGVCDYDRCLGRNGCPAATAFDVSDPALFFATCQGAPHGTRREYSETEMANCCLGAVEPKAFSAAPMAVESCASQLIPFERIVNYNGKPHLLTVVTYRPCE